MIQRAENGTVAHQLSAELGIPVQSVLEFFCVVARFEYALKRLGYLRTDVDWPAADWYGFADRHQDDFDFSRTKQLTEAVDYLIAQPPGQQVENDEGRLGWVDRTRDEDLSEGQWAIRCVKWIRNNLFHGGKFPTGPVDEPARDEKLIRSSLEVLREVARVDEISPYFEDWGLWDDGCGCRPERDQTSG